MKHDPDGRNCGKDRLPQCRSLFNDRWFIQPPDSREQNAAVAVMNQVITPYIHDLMPQCRSRGSQLDVRECEFGGVVGRSYQTVG